MKLFFHPFEKTPDFDDIKSPVWCEQVPQEEDKVIQGKVTPATL